MNRGTSFFLGLGVVLMILIGPVFAESPSSVKEILEEDPKAILNELLELQEPVAKPETGESKSKIAIQSGNHEFININFLEVEIREALSALALEREINIATAQDVSGKITVHLYNVVLDEALKAITMAGGFDYLKHGDLYYIYKPKQAKDPMADKLQMQVIKLNYAEIDKIQEILSAIPGIRTVKIHDPTKTIIVEDTPENIAKIETILSHWDRMPKQVLIEAKILEVTLTDDMSFGVNWQNIVGGDIKFGTGGFSTATLPVDETTSPVPSAGSGLFGGLITGAGTYKQFALALDFLQTKTRVNTLSTPKILAIHAKPAKVQVGGQQGYKVTTTNVGIATETIQFIDTGTILEITPYIYDDGNVLLNVKPSIKAARIVQGVPVVNSTEVSTWLMAKNGETVFIGGLIQDTKTRTRDMIPCLGGIPGLGVLFGRTFRGAGKSELIVLITPNILDAAQKQPGQEAIEKTKEIEKEFKKEPPPMLKQIFDFMAPVK